MKPGMKPDNFQQIYEKGMKPGMKPRYETGLPEKKIPHIGPAGPGPGGRTDGRTGGGRTGGRAGGRQGRF